MEILTRHAEPADYDAIISVVDDWWGGRSMAAMLPRLFFTHFQPTSFVAERDDCIVGFMVGFVSQTDSTQAYIHFIGVDPNVRGASVGRALYERFFRAVETLGCREVLAVTSPSNWESIAFHQRLGFEALPGDVESDGVPYTIDYDEPGESRVRFQRNLRTSRRETGELIDSNTPAHQLT